MTIPTIINILLVALCGTWFGAFLMKELGWFVDAPATKATEINEIAGPHEDWYAEAVRAFSIKNNSASEAASS